MADEEIQVEIEDPQPAGEVEVPDNAETQDPNNADTQTRGGSNIEVIATSGLSRFCNSMICAFIISPIFIIICCIVLGWNERRAVCETRAIAEGKDEVKESTCSDVIADELVMFTCDLQPDGLPTWSGPGDFASALQFEGTGFKVEAEMYQCVERVEETTTKNTGGGGGTTTVKRYYYSKEWRESYVDSSTFRAKSSPEYYNSCGGVENPPWPHWAPSSSVQYASSAMVGPYQIGASFVSSIPLNDNLNLNVTAIPFGWSQSGNAYVRAPSGGIPIGTGSDIGTVRVRFFGNDWGMTEFTVMGKNSDGKISRWTASDSWMCSGFTIGTLHADMLSKDELFANLQAESNAVTYILRVVAFIVMWIAFASVFKPLEVVADCIPCIGPMLGDAVQAVACCVSCPVACACSLFVAGIVWVFMRPMIGGLMLAAFFIIIGIFLAVQFFGRKQRNKVDAPAAGEPDPETVGAS